MRDGMIFQETKPTSAGADVGHHLIRLATLGRGSGMNRIGAVIALVVLAALALALYAAFRTTSHLINVLKGSYQGTTLVAPNGRIRKLGL